jgi:hypothetical protein
VAYGIKGIASSNSCGYWLTNSSTSTRLVNLWVWKLKKFISREILTRPFMAMFKSFSKAL